ncbi:hypothetical protein [Cohnella sp. AR92]|uniref:hypothetical protein n=1 Tax=Cohnella sp. AR92 TaxID=648716 RepID=UPI000F8F0069|nr:hypothetical protein [Cohnella sp. AR92]RUS45960.1 hypothetical protein ELR57_16040 [Cohnella sp. AR92]
MGVKKGLWIALPVLAIALAAIWSSGLAGIWTEGMASIANKTTEYQANGELVEGEYSVTIDLSNLSGNIGKELYNDGVHRIYVSWIDNTGNYGTGGYRIGFRSSGRYSIKGATLVSGIEHRTIDDHTFTMNMSAKMTAEYKGKRYACSEFSTGGLNYKDGDEFGFYLFPSSAYESNEVSLNETGIVKLTVTNLYKNVWSTK